MFFKEVLNIIEDKMPGTKQFFYFQFQKEKENFFENKHIDNENSFMKCKICGFESFQDICTFCKLTNKG